MRIFVFSAVLAASFSCAITTQAITFDWATVVNPGNAGELQSQGTFGAVSDIYRISKHEVTNNQYVDFLNAVDATGTNPGGVYNNSMTRSARGGIDFNAGEGSGSKYSSKTDMGNKPVNYVSIFDSMRFVNWLENGQPTDGSGTESGVYTIGTGISEIRAPLATFFIPSEDEWYKAAYHQPVAQGGDTDDYWSYPTASNTTPTIATANAVGDISNPGVNVANFGRGADWNGLDGNVTTVGSAGARSTSFYGTFDQGGNVWELNETVIGTARVVRGGDWVSLSNSLLSSSRYRKSGGLPTLESSFIGFRVASIPEPSTALLGALASVGLLMRRRRI